MPGRRLSEGVRFFFFLATGLAVPLYAFPVAGVLGRQVDLATVFAALFVLSSVGASLRQHAATAGGVWFALAAVVPALALLPPAAPEFARLGFFVSYGHWLLMIAFFFSSFSLALSGESRARFALWNAAAAAAVALFAIYQVVGIPRGWPGTGSVLVPFQREPLRLIPVWGSVSPEGSYTRPTSIFLEPSWMGGYLAWAFVLGAAAVLRPSRKIRPTVRSLIAVALALILFAIAASVSWGAYVDLGVGAGILLVVFLGGHRFSLRKRVLWIAAGCLILALAAASPAGRRVAGAVSDRWTQLMRTPIGQTATEPEHSDSSWMRAQNLVYTARVFREHPIRGIGLGQFASYVTPEERSSPSFRRDPWCGWVAIGAQLGLLGPLLLFAALVLVLARWRRNRSGGIEGVAVPALVALAFVQQLHTGSYLDLWWWYPVSVAAALSGTVSAGRERLPQPGGGSPAPVSDQEW